MAYVGVEFLIANGFVLIVYQMSQKNEERHSVEAINFIDIKLATLFC